MGNCLRYVYRRIMMRACTNVEQISDICNYYWYVACDNDTKSYTAFIVERIVFKEWINKWLQAIPYAALGAMIFPGILYVKENDPVIGIVGGIVAIVLAFLGL